MKNTHIKLTAIILSIMLVISTTVASYALEKDKTAETKDTGSATQETTEQKGEISKNETVYVIAGKDGSVKKIIVSDWIKNALSSGKLTDKTNLTDIENVKGDEKYTLNGDNMTVWDADGNDIYYQGNIEKELPVGLSISYKLDGENISAEKIAGKSGKVTIRFDYENRQYETVNIDGKDEKIYVPFAMLTGMLLDSDTFRNVEVSNGKLINDGDHTAIIGVALPGLQENLGISNSKFEIPDYVEITADVKNFKLGTTVTIATNELFNEIDTSKFDSVSGITDSIGQLTNGMNQLLDGSSALYNGLDTLLTKSGVLVEGINKLASGAKDLKDASALINNGAADLSAGLDELKSNNATLNGGAKQVFETLLSTANEQLAAGGLNIPAPLTIENYANVLNKVIASLDSTSVYNQALEQVTAAVEEKRPLIEQKVTAGVRDKVAESVIPIATNGQMTKASYDAAVAAGLVPEAQKAAIEAAIDAQMQTDEIKATISQRVEAEVQKAIAENMASDEVQAKLAAASEGSKKVIALKSSLDSYNAFYLGIQAYTKGVSDAADGATKLKDGTSQLKDGINTLYDGVLQLKDGTPALVDGVSQLKNGAMQLSGGLKKLNDEGIGKVTEFVNGDIKNVVTRFKATVDVSKNYRNFAGISDDMDGKVKFIYRTEEIE